MMSSGENIKALRKDLFLSQPELAIKLGVSKTTVGYYEMGKFHPRPSIVKKLIEIAKNELGKAMVREDFED